MNGFSFRGYPLIILVIFMMIVIGFITVIIKITVQNDLMEEISISTEAKLVRFDWAIKHLLRDKANFDIVEGFLSALLKENIEILKILESADSTFNSLDLLVKDNQQRQIVIEIQNSQTPDYLERLLYGVSKVIVDNQQLGEDCRNITKVIVIGVLYFNFGKGEDYVYYSANDFRYLIPAKG
jgi:hypothetical protein